MHCILDGLFPASEAQVQMALGDQMLDLIVTSHGDKLRAKAIATARTDQEGVREIVCNVTLGDESRQARENLTVFSKSGPDPHTLRRDLSRGAWHVRAEPKT